jgi:hypothetical protein
VVVKLIPFPSVIWLLNIFLHDLTRVQIHTLFSLIHLSIHSDNYMYPDNTANEAHVCIRNGADQDIHVEGPVMMTYLQGDVWKRIHGPGQMIISD